MKERFDESKHHLIPRSKWWTNDKRNIVALKDKYHRAFHIVFWNDTPVEQIKRIVKLNQTVLTDETKQDLLNLLSSKDEKEYYKKWALKHK